MNSTEGFFQMILLSIGVIIVFTLIAYMPTLGFSELWTDVNTLIAPLILIICFLGMIAYAVTHR